MYPRAVNVSARNSQHNISRHAMLAWLNDSLGTQYEKIEDLCVGAPYCQLMENMFPGSVPMSNVKLHSNLEHEHFQNFKLLQMAFNKTGVEKIIPINRLVKGRFQDNFEFLQWFEKFHEANYDKRKDEETSATDLGQRTLKGSGVSSSRKKSPSPARGNSNGNSDKRKCDRTMKRNGGSPLRNASSSPAHSNSNAIIDKRNCKTSAAIDASGTDLSQRTLRGSSGSPSRSQSPSPAGAKSNINSDKSKCDRTMKKNGGLPLRKELSSPAHANSNANIDKRNCKTIPAKDAAGTDLGQRALRGRGGSPSRIQSPSPARAKTNINSDKRKYDKTGNGNGGSPHRKESSSKPSTSKAASTGRDLSGGELGHLKHEFDKIYAAGVETIDTLESCKKVRKATYKYMKEIEALCEAAIENESERELLHPKIVNILKKADFGHEPPSNNEQDLKPPDKTDV